MWWGTFGLVGCERHIHIPNKDEATVVISLVDAEDMVIPGALGTAQTINGVCKVQILKSNYPHCITHEVMHCFEGRWHKGNPSTKYCNVSKEQW